MNINLEKVITSFPVLIHRIQKKNQISLSEVKEIFDLKTETEAASILQSVLKIVYYNDYQIYPSKTKGKKQKTIIVDLPKKKKSLVQLPLNQQDLILFDKILSNEPELLKNIIKKFDFHIENSQELLNQHKEFLTKIVEHNTKTIKSSNSKKKEIYFYYKKPLQNIELKKVIPIAIKELIKNFDYIVGYDIYNLDYLKIYRLDRIISIHKTIETNIDLKYDEKLIHDTFDRLTKIDQNTITIKFAYDPQIEMNFENIFDFVKIPKESFSIKGENWHVGKIITYFPESFLEALIPFAKFIYIIEPKELNQKIANYYKELLKNL